MKRVLVVVLVIIATLALVVWVASWFRNPQAVATSTARTWPGGMGTLDSVAGRYPPLRANDASGKLTALAGALPKNEAVEEFVAREIGRGELTIGEPPALPDVAAIRELLLHEAVVWEREQGIGGGNDMNARRTMLMAVRGRSSRARWRKDAQTIRVRGTTCRPCGGSPARPGVARRAAGA